MELEMVNIVDIQPYESNPRKNDKAVDVVAKSIKEFGFRVPIILDDKNVIVAGHTRIKAAIKLGLTEVPAVYAEGLTEEQIKAFRIMDNKAQTYSYWDEELLKGEFEWLQGKMDLGTTGFTEAEVDKILNPEGLTHDGKEEAKYTIEKNKVYTLGKHRIICADATEPETYEKLIGDKDIHLVYTDPPYGVSYKGMSNQGRRSLDRGNNRVWEEIEGDELRNDELFDLIYNSFKQVNQYLKKNGALYIFHASRNQIIFEKALNKANFEIKQQLIWYKHHVLGHAHYHWCHEPIFYAQRIGESPLFYGTRTNKTTLNSFNPEEMEIEELRKVLNKIKEESTVWEIKKDPSKDYIHPTQKPVRMAEKAIINSSQPEENVLDMFGGSGSTLMACEKTNRKCFMIELDPIFCSHIIERWENETGKQWKLEQST